MDERIQRVEAQLSDIAARVAALEQRVTAGPARPADATLWPRMLIALEQKINRYSFYTWFKNTRLIDDDGLTLTVCVEDRMCADWLQQQYSAVILEALADVGRFCTRVEFVPESIFRQGARS